MKKDTTARRSFIKKSGLAILSAVIIPNIIIRKSFGQNKTTIIGHGTHQYKVVEGWGMLDSNINPVNDCHEMVEDAKGRLIMLTNEVKNNIRL